MTEIELDCLMCKTGEWNFYPKSLKMVSATLDQAKVTILSSKTLRSGVTNPKISQSEAWTINYVCNTCQYKETRKNVGRPE